MTVTFAHVYFESSRRFVNTLGCLVFDRQPFRSHKRNKRLLVVFNDRRGPNTLVSPPRSMSCSAGEVHSFTHTHTQLWTAILLHSHECMTLFKVISIPTSYSHTHTHTPKEAHKLIRLTISSYSHVAIWAENRIENSTLVDVFCFDFFLYNSR